VAVTNAESGTNVVEIADGLFRVSTPVPPEMIPGGFTFNQFLIVDDEPLLFHTGPRRLFPLTREAVAHVLAPERLRWISFSHVEADECGALNDWLAVAPAAEPLCSQLAALVSIADLADRPPRGLADGETVRLGRRTVRWVDAPHVPHGMECGYLYDETDGILLCGDLFSQPGDAVPPLTDSAAAIWEPSEAMRQAFPYAPVRDAAGILERLASLEPRVLACMHGSSYRGDGGTLLRKLGQVLSA
jgi:flavorubredoxin